MLLINPWPHCIPIRVLISCAALRRKFERVDARSLVVLSTWRKPIQTKELPGFEPRSGTPVQPVDGLDVDMKRRVMNLNRTELIHLLQLCRVTNIKSDDPLNRLNHTQLCDLVASSAVSCQISLNVHFHFSPWSSARELSVVCDMFRALWCMRS